jgi:hypothetical protein
MYRQQQEDRCSLDSSLYLPGNAVNQHFLVRSAPDISEVYNSFNSLHPFILFWGHTSISDERDARSGRIMLHREVT